MVLPKVSILGCGWLGLPFGKSLVEQGYKVCGATTTPSKVATLELAGIKPFVIKVMRNIEAEDYKEFFQSQILFLNIPFRRDLEDPKFYTWQIEQVVREAEKSSINFIIFASSTSIYPTHNESVNETTAINTARPRVEALSRAEQILLNNHNFDTTIIRFAGLYGPDRLIGNALRAQSDLPGSQSPVNLIHQDDCINIIKHIIEKDVRNEIFNACSPVHPSREELYSLVSRKKGWEAPTFNNAKPFSYKIVESKKLDEHFNYYFKHPDPELFVEQNY